MSQFTDTKTFQSEGGAIAANKLVKLGTASTQVAVATASDAAFGLTINSASAAAKSIPVELLSPNKILTMTAAGAIADKITVVTAADGKVQTITGLTAGTYYKVGLAIGAASGAGSLVDVLIMPWCGDALVVSGS